MSKFKSILNAAKKPDDEDDFSIKPTSPLTEETEPKTIEQKRGSFQSSTKEPTKRGRPQGKRSNPDFEQVTAYIRSDTYRQTKIALLQQEELEDFSELVEKLLTEWLSTQKSENSNI